MAPHAHYVPILQGKRGELIALREFPSSSNSAFTPLIELPAIPWDWEEDQPKKVLADHLVPFPTNIKKSVGEQRVCFIDIPESSVDPADRIEDAHPVAVLFNGFRESNVYAVPVTGPGRDAAYQQAVRDVVTADGRGVCLRVDSSSIGGGLDAELDALLAQLGLTAAQVDLLLDLGSVRPDAINVVTVGVVGILTSQLQRQWRSLTLGSGAFPESLGGLPRGLSTIPRADWSLWLQVRNRLGRDRRMPDFADYAIQAPELAEIDPRTMRVSANIRYTTPEDWLIVRGQIVVGKGRVGFDEYQRLCAALVARPEFRGAGFSPGDQYIAACAVGSEGPGTPEIWRRQGTSHHVATVVDQLATLSAP
jgi:hypothetical protein